MANKLLIVLMNTDPDNGADIVSQLNQATVAAAMEFEVEIVLTGKAGKLAGKAFAEGVKVPGQDDKSVYHYLQQAHKAGVKIKVCATVLEEVGKDIIPEIDETVGGAYIISEAMDDDTVTFTY